VRRWSARALRNAVRSLLNWSWMTELTWSSTARSAGPALRFEIEQDEFGLDEGGADAGVGFEKLFLEFPARVLFGQAFVGAGMAARTSPTVTTLLLTTAA
jgi:hypothetical protein